jgi:PAS domain S-box-containing protein
VAVSPQAVRSEPATASAILAEALDAGQLATLDVDARTGTVAWTGPLRRLIGLTDDADDTGWLDLVHPDDRREVAELLQPPTAGSDTRAVSFRVLRPDATTATVHATVRLHRAPDATVVRVTGIVTDVSEREASRRALQSARDEAEEASRAKNEFLSRMSHELRTPLNSILGFGQLLELEAASPREQQSAGQIVRAGRHLLDLINEVLDVSRIEAGRLALSIEPVPVHDIVTDVLELMSPIALQRSITVVANRPGDVLLHVRADRQRLKQVLVNLVSNAVKYNHDGGAVTVSFDPRPDGGTRICVTDTGPGMSQEQQTRLFRPFERLGADDSDIEGTGLGLVLSLRLVEAMGGTLTVDSRPGAGSTFWFELRSCDPPDLDLDHEFRHLPLAPVRPTRRVLYIEDNLANVRLVERILEHRPNVELIVAMHGQLGLDLAAEHTPDLVLVDLNLPDISGHVLLHRLRADPHTREVPVVVVSADATPGQIASCKAAGADDYLTKPFEIPAFLALVDEFLHDDEVHDPFLERVDAAPEGFEPSVLALLRRISEQDGPADLIDGYDRESRLQLRRLIQASAEGDSDEALRLVHSMKGATATIGATRLASMLGELEHGLAEGSDDVGDLVVVISAELERTVAVLRELF